MVYNQRTQHAVGQGFFHSALLANASPSGPRVSRSRTLRYVYDCGAQWAYRPALIESIDSFERERPERLDLLFLSHLHADHVNGVTLLAQKMPIDTIVMPGISVVERLVVFALSVANGAPPRGFHRALAINPVAALGSLQPRQILIVHRGDDENFGRNQTDLFEGPSDNEGRWTVLDDAADPTKVAEGEIVSGTTIYRVSDKAAISVRLSQESWLLKPYVNESSFDGTGFIQRLAEILDVSKAQLKTDLELGDYVRYLVTDRVQELRQAVGVKRDLNLTSLCLYSGPDFNAMPSNGERHCATVNDRIVTLRDCRLAWLGTGDAQLRTRSKLNTFLGHYIGYTDCVGTLTVPHHGSGHNSDSKLYDAVKAPLCVVAADRYRNWEHPAAKVTQAISSAGSMMSTVTSAHHTKMTEHIEYFG